LIEEVAKQSMRNILQKYITKNRERERGREAERQGGREAERQRGREAERQRGRLRRR